MGHVEESEANNEGTFPRVDDKALHPKAGDAVDSIQCDSPPGFEGTGIVKFECAAGLCPDCPTYQRPVTESKFKKPIYFYCYKNLPTCSKCGAYKLGTKVCNFCSKKKNTNDRGKFNTRKHMAHANLPFQALMLKYKKDLKGFKFHRFKYLTLGKAYTTDVRR